MAQLPPKIPAMAPNWPPFPHHPTSNYFSNTSAVAPSSAVVENHPPSWVDEFLDFTSARRGVHRRSISDSVAFVEVHNSSNALISGHHGFDKLDDEQLMSMFSDDMSSSLPPTSSNPSTPSNQETSNEEKPTMRLDLEQQKPQQEGEPPPQQPQAVVTKTEPMESSNGDPVIIDPKRVKRILANRQSAQRSRVRKLQYISELERSVTTLQTEVSALSPRVAFLDHQRLILNVDNSALKQRIAALAQDKIFKDAHQQALRKEIERLRKVYQQQNLKNTDISTKETLQCTDPKQTRE